MSQSLFNSCQRTILYQRSVEYTKMKILAFADKLLELDMKSAHVQTYGSARDSVKKKKKFIVRWPGCNVRRE